MMNITQCVTKAVRVVHMQKAHCSKLPPELVFPLTHKMIVCWHPEKEFPYEHTKSLPKEQKDLYSASIVDMTREEAQELLLKKTECQRAEHLAKLTYTTKHIWFPKAKKKAKKTEPDRPYL